MRISDWSSDVCSSDLRPDYNAAIVQAMSGETLLLHPLADADLEGLARTLLGADPSLTRAIRTLVQRAGGHPYFVEEAVLALRSAEHTSELQSLLRTLYAVCCLKKNTYCV